MITLSGPEVDALLALGGGVLTHTAAWENKGERRRLYFFEDQVKGRHQAGAVLMLITHGFADEKVEPKKPNDLFIEITAAGKDALAQIGGNA